MTDRELLQQTLVWLDDKEGEYTDEFQNFIDAIRTRLAQPEPEPVAWLEPEWGEQICPEVGYEVKITADHPRDLCWIPLYTTPLKKEWVGLTDDDVDYFVDAIYKGFDMKPRNEVEIAYFERLIKFVGAKLEDKNT